MMEKNRGNLLIFLSTLMFSLGGLGFKMIPWGSMAINGGRCCISALILFLYLRLSGQKFNLTKGTLIAGFCVFSMSTLFSFSNKLTTAANAILIQYVAPVFIILFIWLFFKERPKRLDVITCALVFLGIFCFFLDSLGAGNMLGNFLALLSGVAFAGLFMANKLPGGDAFSATLLGHLLCGLLGLPFLVRETDFSLIPVVFVCVLGVFQLGIGYILFCSGLRTTAPVTASLINGLEPVLNPILVALVVGEMITPLSALGGAIVLVAVTAYNVLLSRRRPIAEDLEEIEALQKQAPPPGPVSVPAAGASGPATKRPDS